MLNTLDHEPDKSLNEQRSPTHSQVKAWVAETEGYFKLTDCYEDFNATSQREQAAIRQVLCRMVKSGILKSEGYKGRYILKYPIKDFPIGSDLPPSQPKDDPGPELEIYKSVHNWALTQSGKGYFSFDACCSALNLTTEKQSRSVMRALRRLDKECMVEYDFAKKSYKSLILFYNEHNLLK